MGKFFRLLILLIVLGIISGCAYNPFVDDSFSNIPNFYQVNGYLYRGGRPSVDGIRQLKEMDIKTIISLRPDDSLTFAERHLARQQEIEFINIPLPLYQRPTDRQVIEFLEIVTDERRYPVFIHCDSGRNQTGAMIAMYRVVVEGWDIKEAYAETKRHGFQSSFGMADGSAELKRFIYQLKDKPQYFEAVGKELILP